MSTTNQKIHKIFFTSAVLMVFLAACAPAETTTPETAAPESTRTNIVTTPPTPTIMVTAPPIPTSLPSQTPTATLSPEEAAAAEQATIRAEVLSYGIDLDDLAHSENEYIRNHPSLALFQVDIDSSFTSEEPNWEPMVVLDIEQLKSVEEFEQAEITDGGWKFIVWAKMAYKKANGEWAIANLPLRAYNLEQESIWQKYTENSEPWVMLNKHPEGFTNPLARSETSGIVYMQDFFERYGNYYLDSGAIFTLYTEYPDPENHYNAGEVGEIPHFTPEEWEIFRFDGDPSIFSYHAFDGTPFIWPFVAYRSDISDIDYQKP